MELVQVFKTPPYYSIRTLEGLMCLDSLLYLFSSTSRFRLNRALYHEAVAFGCDQKEILHLH